MHVWVHGWDWGWMIFTIVWVVGLAGALYVAVKLTNRPPPNLR